jgi:hypothetical protein
MPRKAAKQTTANPLPIDGQLETDRQDVRAPLVRRIATSYPELTTAAVARRVGVSPQYAGRVLKRFYAHTQQDLRVYQENKADIYDATAQRFIESVTPEKLAKTPATSAIIAVGILHDKAALLRGQATGINVSVLLDVASMIRRDE